MYFCVNLVIYISHVKQWATGFTMKFGLYAWEADGSVDRCVSLPFYFGIIASQKSIEAASSTRPCKGALLFDYVQNRHSVFFFLIRQWQQ